MGVPTTSTGQPTPATTASATPARQPLYFVTADGSRSLTPDEGFLAQLRGENVIPVYEKQEESAEEKATREQFLTSAAEAIGTAPAIPPNIASF
jgi:hypothetical protein